MKIRNAKKDDVEGLYSVFLEMAASEDRSSAKIGPDAKRFRIRRKDFERSAKKDLLADVVDRKKRFIVAVEDGEVVGYALGSLVSRESPFFVLPKMGYLNAIAVKKKHRGKRVASALHDYMLAWFKKKGCETANLDVFNTNPAIKIYERWGYRKTVQKMNKKLR